MPKTILIDTSIFIKDNYGFSTKKYQTLRELAKTGEIRVLIPEIVKREVDAHIREDVGNAASALQSFQAKGRILRNLSKEPLNKSPDFW